MEKEVKTSILKRLEEKLKVTEKYKNYIEEELFKIKDKEKKLREKIRKEKEAISLTNKAKKLRLSKKK